MNYGCSCETNVTSLPCEGSYKSFYEIRKDCPVLREIIIPEVILEKHKASLSGKRDEASHISAPYLAYSNGNLNSFCSPLHQWVIQDGHRVPGLIRNYQIDLRETWILKETYTKKYLRFKEFFSRWLEFRVAQWLIDKKWNVTCLEALGGARDIEAMDPYSRKVDFEIKYLAKREPVFMMIVDAMRSYSNVSAYWLDPYSPIDYMLLRIYDAAKQLRDSVNKKIACLIVEDYKLSYECALSGSPTWIDFSNPTFINPQGEIKNLIMKEATKKNSEFPADLNQTCLSLNELWIMTPNGASLDLKHRFSISECLQVPAANVADKS